MMARAVVASNTSAVPSRPSAKPITCLASVKSIVARPALPALTTAIKTYKTRRRVLCSGVMFGLGEMLENQRRFQWHSATPHPAAMRSTSPWSFSIVALWALITRSCASRRLFMKFHMSAAKVATAPESVPIVASIHAMGSSIMRLRGWVR